MRASHSDLSALSNSMLCCVSSVKHDSNNKINETEKYLVVCFFLRPCVLKENVGGESEGDRYTSSTP